MWIEIPAYQIRECQQHSVTPYAGVWIEIDHLLHILCHRLVTPYAGVWIEMILEHYRQSKCRSLPTRECGLKFPCGLAGDLDPCHSLRGSVD